MDKIKESLAKCEGYIDGIRQGINSNHQIALNKAIRLNLKPLLDEVTILTRRIKDIEPELAAQLDKAVSHARQSTNINYIDFGGIMYMVGLLSKKYNKEHKKIFISHASADQEIITPFVENILRLGCGFKVDDIIYTSIESTGIKTGRDMREYLKTNLERCDYVFFMISENYKLSGVCLNEMGGAWVLNKKVKPFLLPNMTFKGLEWLYEISKTSKIDDPKALGTLHDDMLSEYKLISHNTADWDTQRDKFLAAIK